MDEKKVKGVCHERPAREDMISKLPDSLISQILFYLLRNSVVSRRWESLWLLISELDLSSSEFPEYNAFVGFRRQVPREVLLAQAQAKDYET